MELTPKQGNFAQRYVETGNASEAYRQAYDIQSEASEWVKVEASKLLKDPNVAITVIELQKEARERHDVTMDKLTIELEEARLQAMDDPKGAAAAVSAIMAKAKLHGLLVDKTNHTLSEGSMVPTTIEIVRASDFEKIKDGVASE